MQDTPRTDGSRPSRGSGRFLGVLTCFLLSGFAGLLYQTVWLRSFSLVFGTSELAVATVLASYMAGLAAGAAAAAKWAERVRRPVRAYAILELLIAVTAFGVPLGLKAAHALLSSVFGGLAAPPAAGQLSAAVFYLVVGFLLLLVPTGLMGATLPVLSKQAVRRDEELGSRIGLLYAANTAGAVAGTLTAAFVLLPALGLFRTLLCGAGVNVLVFLVAATLARGAGERGAPRPARPAGPLVDAARWVLVLSLVGGAVSFVYEVLWTRLLAHVLGGSVYAFATMLASFLSGITLGSLVASRFARSRERSAVFFALSHAGVAVTSIGVWLAMDALPEWRRGLTESLGSSLAVDSIVAASVLLPSTLCIGATFPFAVRAFARDESAAASGSARVYAWNTFGAILGAVVAGFVLLPALGFEGTVRVAVGANLVLAAAAAFWGRAPAGVRATTALAAVLVPLLWSPSTPEPILRASWFESRAPKGEVVYLGVGRSATVLALEQNGSYYLRSNGLPEARVVRRGAAPESLADTKWLTLLPALGRTRLDEMLVIGFGGGTALEDVPGHVGNVDVIELEPEILAANRSLAGARRKDPFADPRVRVCENDARGALARTDKRYDAIVSQPSHPWTAGASHLYTREFFELVRDHLAPGGTFVQWINVKLIDADLLAILAATVTDTFPHVRVYRPSRVMLLFAASEERFAIEERFADPSIPAGVRAELAARGVARAEDVALRLALADDDVRALGAGAPVNTDDRNRLATRPPWKPRSGVLRALAPFDPLLSREAEIWRWKPDAAYMAQRLVDAGQPGRARRMAESVLTGVERELVLALTELSGSPESAERRLAPWTDDPRAGLVSALARARRGVGPVDGLDGSDAALVRATAAERSEDWAELRSLDGALAAVPDDHLFAAEVRRLRVAWRLSGEPGGTAAPGAAAHGAEALAILDASPLRATAVSHLRLRAQAAARAGDCDALVASYWDLLRFVDDSEVAPGDARGQAMKTALAREIAESARRAETRPGLDCAGLDAILADVAARGVTNP